MADLRTKFMGIDVKNPVVVGACNLSQNPDTLVQLEKAGASAIVYKSLFEEQIQYEKVQMDDSMHEFDERHAEMTSIHPKVEHAGPKEYLMGLKRAKETLSIPLIGSLNAVYKETWVEYAQLIQETGVDGLELNFYAVPKDFNSDAETLENKQIDILKAVKKVVSIPIAVKIGPFYSNPLHIASKMDEAGVNGFVLFNRLFQPDIDVDSEKHIFPFFLSREGDYRLSLRFTGMLYKHVKGNICGNTGIYSGSDVAKMILAGADSVQIVSAIYKNKPKHISKILTELESWMDSKSYNSIKDFKGNLSKAGSTDPFAYSRAQYVDIIMKPEEIIKKYPVV
ncbi:MAG: dihydroorotate dehydrogenase-like protein [Bacteroidales bacterium]